MIEKNSPLSGIYKHHSAQLTEIAGWKIAEFFGNPDQESKSLKNLCVLSDWSHIGKISLSRGKSPEVAEKMIKGAGGIEILKSLNYKDAVSLRLTQNDYLFLCEAGNEEKYLKKITLNKTTVINQTGAMGCFALAGPRRDEVLERSTAVDLRRDRVTVGSVLQSTVHTVACTIYRSETFDVLVHARSFSESLFDSLMDVGMGLGLMPAGIGTLPVSLSKEST